MTIQILKKSYFKGLAEILLPEQKGVQNAFCYAIVRGGKIYATNKAIVARVDLEKVYGIKSLESLEGAVFSKEMIKAISSAKAEYVKFLADRVEILSPPQKDPYSEEPIQKVAMSFKYYAHMNGDFINYAMYYPKLDNLFLFDNPQPQLRAHLDCSLMRKAFSCLYDNNATIEFQGSYCKVSSEAGGTQIVFGFYQEEDD